MLFCKRCGFKLYNLELFSSFYLVNPYSLIVCYVCCNILVQVHPAHLENPRVFGICALDQDPPPRLPSFTKIVLPFGLRTKGNPRLGLGVVVM